jgi:hypothetical protein
VGFGGAGIVERYGWEMSVVDEGVRRGRTADPWRDTEVIDARAPRFNQAVVGVVALAGVLLGWPLLWALMGLQLAMGLVLGGGGASLASSITK